ncbi:MAG: hypothetical protein WCK97_07330 [Actinomycetes bacterium]
MIKTRGLLTLSLTVVAVAALPVAAQAATAKAAGSCGQFRVMHNDHINGVSFPYGLYNMVNSGASTGISCAQTTKYMQQFLDNDKVASGWTVKLLSGQRRRFTKLHTKPTVDFQATPVAEPTPSASSLNCAGTFRVMHNDHIGAMSLQAGEYRIALNSADTPGLNCRSASNDFSYFLAADWSGDLPRPWKMNVSAKSFYMNDNTRDGFNVKRVGG